MQLFSFITCSGGLVLLPVHHYIKHKYTWVYYSVSCDFLVLHL